VARSDSGNTEEDDRNIQVAGVSDSQISLTKADERWTESEVKRHAVT